ncbi:MAG: PKD domain-containing protein [Chitinophagaceae bacterium]|nr:PKD domain-containing protein [Chitinophagaceae bacterium]
MRSAFTLSMLLAFAVSVYAQKRPFPELQQPVASSPVSHRLLVYFPDTSKIPVVNNDKPARRPVMSNTDSSFHQLIRKYKLTKIEKAFPSASAFSWHPKGATLLNYYLLTFEGDARKVLQSFRSDRTSSQMKMDVYEEPRLLYVPDDYYITQNGQQTAASPALEYIRAREAWDVTKGSSSVKIGISDISFDTNCNELMSKAEMGAGVITSGTGGHGTRVACIAAGATDNGEGLPSIGFNSRLICTSLGYDGILDAVQRGAKVVNCSWITSISPLNETNVHNDVIDLVTGLGVTVVAGAGNGELGERNFAFPASCDNVISVTSVGHLYDIGHPGFYCWKDVHTAQVQFPANETHTHNTRVDICAPGYSVYSTSANGVYNFGWGSSFAAPFVSGTAALLYAVQPDITPAEVEEILKCSAVRIDTISYNRPYAGKLGAGRLDAAAAVQVAAAKKLLTKPQDIKWYGINNLNQRVAIDPDQFSNYSQLEFEVTDNSPGSVFEWQLNSYNKIIYKTGTTIRVFLSELDLNGNGSCQHLEVRVRRGAGCGATYYLAEIKRCPVANFTTRILPGISCTSFTVKFFNTSSDGDTYLWSFGDGTTSTERDPEHIYTLPGEITVTLTVNGVAVRSELLVLGGRIYLNGVASVNEFCENIPVALSYGATECGTTFKWNFGDGTAESLERNPSHIFTGMGPYTVSLTVDNNFTITRVIWGKPSRFDISIRPASASCNNNKFTFSPLITRGCAATYQWSFGNGTQFTGPYPAQVTYSPGNYTVQLTVNGQVTTSRSVTVGTPFANFSMATGTITNGEYVFAPGIPVLFTDNSVCAGSYQWNFGDGTVSSLKNPSKTYSSPGVYVISLTINGNSSYRMTRNLVISPACNVASAITTEGITSYSSIIKWGGTSAGVTLRYRKSGASAWTTISNIHPPYLLTGLLSATLYEFTLTAACESSPSAVVKTFTTTQACGLVPSMLNVSMSFNGAACEGSSLQLAIAAVSGATYSWTGPGGFTSGLQNPVITNFTAANSGTYYCTVTTNVCTVSSGGVSVSIPVIPVPAGLSAGQVTDRSAVISWSPQGAELTASLQYKKQNALAWTELSNVHQPYTLAGLDYNTLYNVRIRFEKSLCTGAWSPEISLQTLQGCIVPPSSYVTAISITGAMLSWPDLNPGQQYRLSVRNVSASGSFTEVANSIQGTNTTLTYQLSGLAPSTAYEYRIEPVCQPASGITFTNGSFTTLPVDCIPPSNLSVTFDGGASVILNWTNAAGITTTKIEYRIAGNTDYVLATASASGTTFSLQGLLPGNNYEYRLTPVCMNTGISQSVTGTFTVPWSGCTGQQVINSCTAVLSDGSNGANYPANMSCSWLVNVPGANSITLRFTRFETEITRDVVAVYKGNQPFATNLVGRFSGSTVPGERVIQGSSMLIIFTSNSNNITGSGWEAVYTTNLCQPVQKQMPVSITSGGFIISGGDKASVNYINISPNPYIDQVSISLKKEIPDGELILSDESGKLIYQKHYDLMEKNIVLSFGETLPPANYKLTIRDKEDIIYHGQLVNQKASFITSVHINEDVTAGQAISVYPNPYVDNFTIDVRRELKDVSLVMTDLHGRILYKKDFTSMYRQTRVDLGYLLAAGVYILIIRNKEGILFRQRIIARK